MCKLVAYLNPSEERMSRRTPTAEELAAMVNIEPPKVYIEEVDVTKKLAAHWLGLNAENNRNEKPFRIRKYSRDMAYGRWIITGDTIKITADDEMIDGGQRMRSVLRAYADYENIVDADWRREHPTMRPVKMLFARNVPRDAMLVTDTGAGRTFADALKIEDAINQNQCGAIVRRTHVWKQGNPAGLRGSNTGFVDPTMTELLELYRSDRQQFDAAALRGLDIRGQRVGNATAAGTAYYMLNQLDHDTASNFFDDLVSGAHPDSKYPVWVLRERLRKAHSRLDRSNYLTVTEQMFFIVRAWNAYLKDEPMEKLQLPEQRIITNLNFPKALDPNNL